MDRLTKAIDLADDLDKWVRVVCDIVGPQRSDKLKEVSGMLRDLVQDVELNRKAMFNRTHGHGGY